MHVCRYTYTHIYFLKLKYTGNKESNYVSWSEDIVSISLVGTVGEWSHTGTTNRKAARIQIRGFTGQGLGRTID